MIDSISEGIENIVRKGENAGYQHFLPHPRCSHMLLTYNVWGGGNQINSNAKVTVAYKSYLSNRNRVCIEARSDNAVEQADLNKMYLN